PDLDFLSFPQVARRISTPGARLTDRHIRPGYSACMSEQRTPKEAVIQALQAVKDPDLHRDIVTLNFVKNLKIEGNKASFTLELTTPACPVKEKLEQAARQDR